MFEAVARLLDLQILTRILLSCRHLKQLSSQSRRLFLSLTASSSSALSLKQYVYLALHFESATSSNICLQKTATGIFLPSSATSSPLPEATVISVGPGAPDKEGKIVPTTVKAGDRVLLPGWGGNSIKVGEDVSIFIPVFVVETRFLG